jgi:hypothetical protein
MRICVVCELNSITMVVCACLEVARMMEHQCQDLARNTGFHRDTIYLYIKAVAFAFAVVTLFFVLLSGLFFVAFEMIAP